MHVRKVILGAVVVGCLGSGVVQSFLHGDQLDKIRLVVGGYAYRLQVLLGLAGTVGLEGEMELIDLLHRCACSREVHIDQQVLSRVVTADLPDLAVVDGHVSLGDIFRNGAARIDRELIDHGIVLILVIGGGCRAAAVRIQALTDEIGRTPHAAGGGIALAAEVVQLRALGLGRHLDGHGLDHLPRRGGCREVHIDQQVLSIAVTADLPDLAVVDGHVSLGDIFRNGAARIDRELIDHGIVLILVIGGGCRAAAVRIQALTDEIGRTPHAAGGGIALAAEVVQLRALGLGRHLDGHGLDHLPRREGCREVHIDQQVLSIAVTADLPDLTVVDGHVSLGDTLCNGVARVDRELIDHGIVRILVIGGGFRAAAVRIQALTEKTGRISHAAGGGIALAVEVFQLRALRLGLHLDGHGLDLLSRCGGCRDVHKNTNRV